MTPCIETCTIDSWVRPVRDAITGGLYPGEAIVYYELWIIDERII